MGKKRVNNNPKGVKPINTVSDPQPTVQDANAEVDSESEDELSGLAPLFSDMDLDNDESTQEDSMEVDVQASEEFNPRIKEFEPQPVPRAYTGGLLTRKPNEDEIEQQRKVWEKETTKEAKEDLAVWQKCRSLLETKETLKEPEKLPENKDLAEKLEFYQKKFKDNRPYGEQRYMSHVAENTRKGSVGERNSDLEKLAPAVVSSFRKDHAQLINFRDTLAQGRQNMLQLRAEEERAQFEAKKKIFRPQ